MSSDPRRVASRYEYKCGGGVSADSQEAFEAAGNSRNSRLTIVFMGEHSQHQWNRPWKAVRVERAKAERSVAASSRVWDGKGGWHFAGRGVHEG